MAKARKSTKKMVAFPLARVGDPLLYMGKVYEPISAGIDVEKSQPKIKPNGYKPSKSRNLSDLGANPGVLNGIICVFVYSILGISNREMADALRITEKDIKEIKKHPSYSEIFDMVKDEFINVNSDLMEARIAAYGGNAITQMAHLAFKSKNEVVQFRASQDFLDRGGIGKKNDTKVSLDGALRIVVTNGDDSKEVTIGGEDVLP